MVGELRSLLCDLTYEDGKASADSGMSKDKIYSLASLTERTLLSEKEYLHLHAPAVENLMRVGSITEPVNTALSFNPLPPNNRNRTFSGNSSVGSSHRNRAPHDLSRVR
uniref:Uncharacterized protein n=1 Tax=Timema tahoe TaxID=61484 RepID=A0A7R9INM7_9NEOP|nr:unnamed protein product [Timema tahoe]